jgi:hypothetical protein
LVEWISIPQLRYHNFDTKPDTEFNLSGGGGLQVRYEQTVRGERRRPLPHSRIWNQWWAGSALRLEDATSPAANTLPPPPSCSGAS